MSIPKMLCGFCALLAVVIFALPVGASAQTAFECAPGSANPGFKDAHCKEATASGAKFDHVALPSGAVPITWTNIWTGTEFSRLKLKSVQSGITLEVQSSEVEGEGQIENKVEGGSTWTEGSSTFVLKNVEVTLPAGKGCKVVGGQITTKPIVLTTKGLTNQLKFLPSASGIFAEVQIENCLWSELNHAYTAAGSFIGNTEGATTNFTHTAVTTQHTLRFFGQNMGIEGSLTIKRKSTGNGIAFT